MQLSSMVQLGLTGLLAACLPLSMVWMSSDPNKYRKLVWITVFLTFDLIVFGAFTRLTDSGLGCPDWPGCYGAANPFLAHAEIIKAETLMPSGPVTLVKAWIEMIHRYLAMGIGVLIVALMGTAWNQWRKTRRAEYAPALPTMLFVFVLVQGAFGAWTVTLKLQPVIVTIHLLLGMGLLAMLVWLGARQNRASALAHGRFTAPDASAGAAPGMPGRLALAAAVVLAIQIALGGWVSTNYATMACLDYPLCNGKLVPEMDFGHGFHLWRELGKTAAGHYLPFSALTAIHWVHRNFAFVVLAVLGLAAWRARAHPGVARHARGIGIVLAVQAVSGIATVYLNFPLTIAVLHNAGAALLVLMVTMLNYKIKYPSGPVLQASHHP
ncbi:COX15/CtaA family protein [Massilia rubra]|uniref:Heme A synthase n=1 Tax=Massilia rubra TaxID=2607910 RepID=A0ABX0LQV2_9BURK|nr:COX15/CtaA family protein [Massilia rubra]NHZ35215.1 heme A synthase [Massilia rubra]